MVAREPQEIIILANIKNIYMKKRENPMDPFKSNCLEFTDIPYSLMLSPYCTKAAFHILT